MEESRSGSRPTVSILKACEALNVPRVAMYDYIVTGSVEYVRTLGGSIRIFVDTLAGADRRRAESLKRDLRERLAARLAPTPNRATGSPFDRAPQEPLRDQPLFRWSGPPQLVRNAGRPAAGQSCPCCASCLVTENRYEGRESEYETEEMIYCLLCGWASHYECRPLTRGVDSQFSIVKTLRSFATTTGRITELHRRLEVSPSALPLKQRVEAVVADVVRKRSSWLITSAVSDDGADILLATRFGGRPVVIQCRQPAGRDEVDAAAVSLIHSINIAWDTGVMRLHTRAHPVTSGVIESASARHRLTVSIVDGRQFLEFIGVCARAQPRLEVLTSAHREEIVSRHRRNSDRYRDRLNLHSLFHAFRVPAPRFETHP